jgi:catechol 2,3-dioxygenase-like lactoylglutathione lyase family enzyme
MPVALQISGIHHVTLRAFDLKRAHAFYGGTLGLPIVLETSDSFVALAGSTVLVIRDLVSPTRTGDRVDAPCAGLVDHVALACARACDLEHLAAALAAEGIPATRVRFDPVLQRRFVAFRDPGGIAWRVVDDSAHGAAARSQWPNGSEVR